MGDILLDVATAPRGGPGHSLLQVAESAILAALQVTQSEVLQLRLAARRWRLTSSKFHEVRRVGRQRQLAEFMLGNWWYRSGPPSLKRERAQRFEEKALRRHARLAEQNEVVQTGLLVDPEVPWLGASPDAVELAANGQPVALVEVKSYPFIISAKSPAFAQVQGAMAVASACFGRPIHRCRVLTPEEVIHVRFDAAWWQRLLLKLREFYFGMFLPLAAQQVVDQHMSDVCSKTY